MSEASTESNDDSGRLTENKYEESTQLGAALDDQATAGPHPLRGYPSLSKILEDETT